jgi:isoleucyl-tRNA synthetase
VFTAEEAWVARFGESACVHLQEFAVVPAAWRDDALAAKWDQIRVDRRLITVAAEQARKDEGFGSSLEMGVWLDLPTDRRLLTPAAWAEVAIVSEVRFQEREGGEGWLPGATIYRAEGRKCARCWKVLREVGEHPRHAALCVRCADAVESGLVCKAVAE